MTVISAVLPVVVLLFFIYRKDKASPEPLGLLGKAFGVGCLSVLPAALQEMLLEVVTPDGVLGGLFRGYVVAGFSEELWKLLMLYWVVWRSAEFDEYFDGIVYAVFVSMGFACVENVGYVAGSTDPMGLAMMRGVLAVPAHFLFAVMMGYHFSLAKFDPAARSRHMTRALVYPLLMHGTYDALLMVSEAIGATYGDEDGVVTVVCGVLTVVFVVFDVMMWRWGIGRIKRMQERSREQGFDRSHPFDGFTWNV